MSDWVYAVWLPTDESLSTYERKVRDIASLSGESIGNVRKIVSARAESRPITHVEAAEFIYSHYLKFGEFPNE